MSDKTDSRIIAKNLLTDAIGKDCVFSIDGKMWNTGNLNANTIVDSMLEFADQELASLREQLKEKDFELFKANSELGSRDAEIHSRDLEITKAKGELKQKEDENRELKHILKRIIPLAEDGHALHKRNGCHQEFLSEDIERIDIAKNLSA